MNEEQKKWMEIAEAYLTSRDEATPETDSIACMGLCAAIDDAWDYQLTYEADKILEGCNDQPKDDGWWPFYGDIDWTRQCDLERGLLACFIATMPPEIYKEFAE